MAARLVTVALLLAAAVAGVALMLQRQRGTVLREQITLLRADQRQLAALRADNAKLQSGLPSDSELMKLRADHAAAMRLQTELNTLRRQISAAEAAAGVGGK